VIGSYAINNLDTSSRIADVLVGLQAADLGSDYINTRRERINSVTLEEAREIAKKLLSADPTMVTIGPGQS
jgi:zinc protease